jgi:spermidine dehydrogenase
MPVPFTRRDFLNATLTLLASGSALRAPPLPGKPLYRHRGEHVRLPVVFTLKILFSYPGQTLAAQVARGRAELLSTPYREYERRIRQQLTAVFGGSGFDADRDVAGLVLNRWGHAYLSPQPGFFFGQDGQPAPGEVLRLRPVGRIAFANSDLSGIMDHRASILEADRAVRQLAG